MENGKRMSSVKGVCPMLPGCPSGQKNGSGGQRTEAAV